MGRAVWLADELRRWLTPIDVEVVEVAGWQTRGYDFPAAKPTVSVAHHTAGSATGETPSLGICINGRSGLPGPLCNDYVNRSATTVYAVAAGKSNNAGVGGFAGESSNYGVLGTEVENTGTAREPWTAHQLEVMARVHAAHISGINASLGQHNTARSCCEHKEWAPTRKIDRHTVLGAATRARVAELLANGPATGDDDMTPEQAQQLAATAALVVDLHQWMTAEKDGAGPLSTRVGAVESKLDGITNPTMKVEGEFRSVENP